MIAPAQSLAAVPDELTPEVAAPLMCAGITTYNALRNSGARPGDLVAIQAIGGLGHLAVQYANKFGYRVVAIGRDDSTKDLALKLGASAHIASGQTNAGEELQKMGGAQVILCTAPSGKAMSGLIGGLGVLGKLLVVGASGEAIEVTPVQLIGGELTVTGWAAGTSIDSEDALRFSQLSGVRPMIEKFPLARAAEAYDRMMSGKARFRVVLMME
jgi:D-arabinose 1-dehydrogenase-like Zn-dependent alcohol dehydrogenase